MKKWIALLTIVLMLNLIGMTTSSALAAAEDSNKAPIVVNNGKIINGRTLIPIRVVSTNFGFQVNWNQGSKTVTISNSDTHITLQMNANKANVNDKEVILDVPAQIYSGVTYVPLKFLGEAFGATVSWNQTFKAARAKLADSDILIYTQVKPIPELTDTQIQNFSQIANKAAVITDIHNAKAYFKPYLTDALLGNIIWYKGLPFKTQFDSKSYSKLIYNDIYHSTAVISQTAHFTTLVWVSRTMEFKYVDNSWKINKIDFKYVYF